MPHVHEVNTENGQANDDKGKTPFHKGEARVEETSTDHGANSDDSAVNETDAARQGTAQEHGNGQEDDVHVKQYGHHQWAYVPMSENHQNGDNERTANDNRFDELFLAHQITKRHNHRHHEKHGESNTQPTVRHCCFIGPRAEERTVHNHVY